MRAATISLGYGLVALALTGAGPAEARTAAPVPAPVTNTGEAFMHSAVQPPSPEELSSALLAHGSGEVAAGDLRAIQCEEVGHAPGAFDCRWEQRMRGDWRLHTTWLAQVGESWTVLDAPLPVPDFDRGRLKALERDVLP